MRLGTRVVATAAALAFATAGLAPGMALADEADDLDSVRAEMEQAGDELKDYQTSLSMSSEQLEQLKGQISQVQSQIDQTQADYDAAKQTLSGRVRANYRDGNESVLDILLGSKSMEEFVSNLYYVASLNKSDMQALSTAKKLSQQLYDQKSDLEAKEAAGEEAKNASAAKANEYQDKVRQIQAKFNSLSSDVKQQLIDEAKNAAQSGDEQADSQGVIQDSMLNVVTTVAQADYSDAVASGDTSSLADNAAVQAVVSVAAPTTTNQSTGSATPTATTSTQGNATTATSGSSAAPASSTSASSGSSASGSWLSRAQSVLGTPYVWGGSDTSGMDCSGYVNYVYGGSRGRTTYDMMSSAQSDGTWSTDFSNMQPGDVIITSGGSHVGIYAGDGKMYNSTRPGEGVQLSDLSYFDEVGYIPGSKY